MTESEALSFVLRGKNRVKILTALKEGRKISAQIEKETGMYKSHVSRALKELLAKEMIRCVNPTDRNFKFYELTREGKQSLVEAKKILKDIT